MKQNQIFQFLVIVLLMAGCKKGETGPAGQDGKPGSANITSNTYSITSWPYSSPYYYTNLATAALTSTNVNSAAVMVYFSTGSVWNALPYSQYNSPYNYYMGFNTSAGNVQVTWFYDTSLSTGDSPNTYYGTTIQIKVVVIPPAMIKKDVNIRNYEEVKSAYHLTN